MAEFQLIVTNPPHRSPDPVAVAPHLKCSAAEVRMKLNFPAPEIWLAESDTNAAREAAQALTAAGVNVAWIPGSVLAAVPHAFAALRIAIDSAIVNIATQDGELAIKAGDRVIAVLGEPVRLAGRQVSERSSLMTKKVVNKLDTVNADARDSAQKRMSDPKGTEPSEPFLDIYRFGDGGWKATRLQPSYTDFSGLGDRKQPTGRANMAAIVDALRQDFDTRIDERLVKVAYKPAIVSGLALTQVLSSVSEQLASMPLLDIASRLVFLTAKG